MNKKTYISPAVMEYRIETTQMMAVSLRDTAADKDLEVLGNEDAYFDIWE